MTEQSAFVLPKCYAPVSVDPQIIISCQNPHTPHHVTIRTSFLQIMMWIPR